MKTLHLNKPIQPWRKNRIYRKFIAVAHHVARTRRIDGHHARIWEKNGLYADPSEQKKETEARNLAGLYDPPLGR